jgi:hypothetical protein
MGLLKKEKFVLFGQSSGFAICKLIKKLGTWRVSHVWEKETNAIREEEWLQALDAWLAKIPLRIRQKVRYAIIPSEKLEFRLLNLPTVSKKNHKQAIHFELERTMRDSDGNSTKWVFHCANGFINENKDALFCFATKHSFLETWLELLAKRYISVRHVFIDSLLPLFFFEKNPCKAPILFIYAGAHVITLCFREGKKIKTMAISYDHPGLLKNFRKTISVHGDVPLDDSRMVQEILAADLTTASGACGMQERQQLHSKLKQAEFTLYREASTTEYHQTVLSAYHPSAYAFVEQTLKEAGKGVISASEYFKFIWGRRVPEAAKIALEPSLAVICGTATARPKTFPFYQDMIPSSWKADYVFTRSKAFILGTVLILLTFFFGELSILKMKNQSSSVEVSALKIFQQEVIQMENAIAEANSHIKTKQKDADRIRSLVKHQDAWLKFFNNIMAQTAKAQTLWFDEWEWKSSATLPQITIKGTMLAAEALDSQNSDQRMAQFLQGIRQVTFVKDIQNIKLLMKDEFLISFSFDLILNKETLLSL